MRCVKHGHPAFYEAAAQIIPVLLLALVLETRFFHENEDERIGDSLWIVGFIAALVVGEVSALGALLAQRTLSPIEEAVIWIAIFYGVSIVAVAPIAGRLRRVRAETPGWLNAAAGSILLLGVLVVVLLATWTGVITDRDLGIIASVAVLALIIVGSFLSIIARTRR